MHGYEPLHAHNRSAVIMSLTMLASSRLMPELLKADTALNAPVHL